MKLHVLVFYNVLISTFTTPQFTDIEPENAAIQLSRSLVLSNEKEPDKVRSYDSLILYHIADFDDQTGTITPLSHPVQLLSCIDVVNHLKLEAVKKAAEDEKLDALKAADDEKIEEVSTHAGN